MPTARSNRPAALFAALLAMLIVTAAVARTSQAAFTATFRAGMPGGDRDRDDHRQRRGSCTV